MTVFKDENNNKEICKKKKKISKMVLNSGT